MTGYSKRYTLLRIMKKQENGLLVEKQPQDVLPGKESKTSIIH